MKGRLITLEGIDGAGKSSFVGVVERRLRAAAGREVVVTREPGGTEAGEALRRLLLSVELTPLAETLLVFAARAEHLQRLIRPALERGAWVLCDRYTDATYAYQGAGRGVSPDGIRLLEQWVQAGVVPHLTLLFDLPVEIAKARSAGARAPDRFESERSAFFQCVRDGYLERAAQEPARFRVIDAARSPGEIEAQLAAIDFDA